MRLPKGQRLVTAGEMAAIDHGRDIQQGSPVAFAHGARRAGIGARVIHRLVARRHGRPARHAGVR